MARNEMIPVRREIVLAMADCNMSAAEVSRKLFMDYSTVLYHIRLIKEITGKNPRNLYDLCDLVAMVKGGGCDG